MQHRSPAAAAAWSAGRGLAISTQQLRNVKRKSSVREKETKREVREGGGGSKKRADARGGGGRD
ncbi:MAG: hypothetical protein ACKESB_02940 [Candidatus Hodgkinia cicadicola]